MRDLSIFDNAIEITPARKKQSYTPATIAVRKMHGKWYSHIVLRADLAVWVFQHTRYRIKLAGPSKNLILLIPDSTGRYKPGNKNGTANINLLQVEGWPQAETTFGANYEIVKGSLYLELPENWQDKVNQKQVEPDIPTPVKVLSTPVADVKTAYSDEHFCQPASVKTILNSISDKDYEIKESKLTVSSTSDGKVETLGKSPERVREDVEVKPTPVLEKPIIPVMTKPAPILTKTVNPLTKPVKQIPITTTARGLESIVNKYMVTNQVGSKPQVGPNGKVLVPMTAEEKEDRRKHSKGPTMIRAHVVAAEEQARASRASKSLAMRYADFRRKKDD